MPEVFDGGGGFEGGEGFGFAALGGAVVHDGDGGFEGFDEGGAVGLGEAVVGDLVDVDGADAV